MAVVGEWDKVDEMDAVVAERGRSDWAKRQSKLPHFDPLDEPMTVRCMHCDWSWTAPAKEVIALHRAHRKHRHSEKAASESSPSIAAARRTKYGQKRKREETVLLRNRVIALLRDGDKSSVELAAAVGVEHPEKVGTILTWSIRQRQCPGLWSYFPNGVKNNVKVWSLRPDRVIPPDPRVAKVLELVREEERTTHELAELTGESGQAVGALFRSCKQMEPRLARQQGKGTMIWRVEDA